MFAVYTMINRRIFFKNHTNQKHRYSRKITKDINRCFTKEEPYINHMKI